MLSTHPHETSLPSPEERRKILERAGLILAEARALMEQLDRTERYHVRPWQPGSLLAVNSAWQSAGSGLAAFSAEMRAAAPLYGQATAG